jgi:hypothetical protein
VASGIEGEMGNSGRHVWVLGAGASAESANTPLGKGLVWDYHSDSFLLLPTDDMGLALREENERFRNLRTYLELVASIYPDFKFLLEHWDNRGNKVFQAGSRLEKRLYFDEILAILQKTGNEDGIKCVRQVIFEHIAEASLDSPNILYKRFVKGILKNKPLQTTSIISLNFDCLLNEDFDSQVYFDYLIDFEWIDPNGAQFYRRCNPIPLIKLHGSMDWGICSSCGRLHLYYPFMHRTFYEGRTCTDQQCRGIVTPFIVIQPDKERINPLWNIARNHLKEAEQVTVIGYSFPEYDRDVISLFRDSLDTNARIEVVDKCRDSQKKEQAEYFRKRYRDLFPNIKRSIEVALDGFSGYLDAQETTKLNT